ncbi:MAG: hypothetical protein ACTHLE_01575 [Agriterribacter sp.]
MKHSLLATALLSIFFASSSAVFSQSKIKDGTVTGSTNLPHAAALVEFESNNKGVLLPRVELTATNDALPLTAHVAGMMVYNTATAGTAPNNVTPGFYYNTGSAWARLIADNSGKADTTNDGWKDDAANAQVRLAYKSDGSTVRGAGTEFVIKDNGNVGIGVATAPANKLHVQATANPLRLEGLQTTEAKAGTLVIEGNGEVKVQKPSTVSAVRANGIFTISTTGSWESVSGTNTEYIDNLSEFSGNTFTAKNDGIYRASLTIRYPQRSAGADSDGYVGGSFISSSVTGSGIEVHTKVPAPESGVSAVFIASTNTAIFKLAAGQIIQFYASTIGSVSTSTSDYRYDISIERVD